MACDPHTDDMAAKGRFDWAARAVGWEFLVDPVELNAQLSKAVVVGMDLGSKPSETIVSRRPGMTALSDEEIAELVKPPKWSPPPIPMWPVGSVTYVDEKFVEPPATSTAEICRQAMEKIHESVSPPMTATDVRRRWASMPDHFAGWNKAIIDRMFEIMRENGLIPEPPAALASPAAPPDPSPLPPNLFNRMERNRGARVAGAAHFVEGLD